MRKAFLLSFVASIIVGGTLTWASDSKAEFPIGLKRWQLLSSTDCIACDFGTCNC